MTTTCPDCRTELTVPPDAIDGETHCPGCGRSVKFSREAVEEIYDAEVVEAPDADAATKPCPMCGASIKAAARNCRFCGEILDDHERATGDRQGVWRSGNQLVMSKQAKLPDRCVKTNEPAERQLRRRLYWHHPLVYLLIFCPGSLLLYAIVAIIVRQKAEIYVGLTRKSLNRRRWTIAGAWLGVLVGLSVLFTGPAMVNRPEWVGPVMMVSGLILFLTSVIVGVILSSVVRPARITKDYVWLKGVHPDYLNSLHEFPGE